MTPPSSHDDDALLRSLGQLAREQAESEAATVMPDLEPELQQALSPLDAAEQQDITAALLARSTGPAPDRTAEPAPIPLRSRRRSWMAGAGVLAAAAVLLIALRPTGPSLPTYELLVEGGDLTVRGEQAPQAPAPVLTDGSRLKLQLRPEHASKQPITVSVEAQRGDAVRPLKLATEMSETGSVRLRGLAGPGEAIDLPAGEWTLVVTVAPADGRGTPRVLRQAVRIMPGGSSAP